MSRTTVKVSMKTKGVDEVADYRKDVETGRIQ